MGFWSSPIEPFLRQASSRDASSLKSSAASILETGEAAYSSLSPLYQPLDHLLPNQLPWKRRKSDRSESHYGHGTRSHRD